MLLIFFSYEKGEIDFFGDFFFSGLQFHAAYLKRS